MTAATIEEGRTRKRNRIAELLETAKRKREVLRQEENNAEHKELKDITGGLSVGAKIYVRYLYDDLMESEDSETSPIVIKSKTVWWPAIIRPYAADEPLRIWTAEEVFKQMDLADNDYKRDLQELIKKYGSRPMYVLDYVGRDEFLPESVPCFFMDEETLCHLHSTWGAATYRNEGNLEDEEDEEELEDGIKAVADLFGPDDEMFGRSYSEVADRLVGFLTNFYRHAESVDSRTMTSDDVWSYFSATVPELTVVLTTGDNDRLETRITRSYPVASPPSPNEGGEEPGECHLQSTPFPRR